MNSNTFSASEIKKHWNYVDHSKWFILFLHFLGWRDSRAEPVSRKIERANVRTRGIDRFNTKRLRKPNQRNDENSGNPWVISFFVNLYYGRIKLWFSNYSLQNLLFYSRRMIQPKMKWRMFFKLLKSLLLIMIKRAKKLKLKVVNIIRSPTNFLRNR